MSLASQSKSMNQKSNTNNTTIELKDFILEIGVEDLPARLLNNISSYIKDELQKLLESNEINYESINSAYTPRRLFFEITKLESQTKDKNLEIKGPPEKIAVGEDGKFNQAALGFAKKNNVNEQDLQIKDGYIYGNSFVKGVSSKEILAQNLSQIIAGVPGERFMRWADGSVKFSRPISWIASVIYSPEKTDTETIDFEVEDIKSNNISYGHRFLGPDSFVIENKEQYLEQLKKQGVYLDSQARKEKIISEANQLAQSIGGEALLEDELLEEVTGLIENPTAILCSFDEKFLKLPACVIKTVMEIHQKYFPVYEQGSLSTDHKSIEKINAKLKPNFIITSNNPLEKAHKNIKEGNEKVIIPRLKDAEFFFDEDNKQSLEEHLEKLSKLNFQAGNMRQKADRIQKISKYMIKELENSFDHNPAKLPGEALDSESKASILEAALLAKADLNTQMVFEFTELQGEIGGIYAAHQGKSQATANAISEHYMPRFAGDKIPQSIGGKIISIADKLDNLVCIFALGKIPKGSADPFALRRQANGLLEIAIHSHLIINLDKLIDFATNLGETSFGSGRTITKTRGKGDKKKTIEMPEFDWSKAKEEVKNFLKQRLEFVFEMNHKGKEINNAVISSGNPLASLNTKHMMIHYLYDLKEQKQYPEFLEAANRISRIGEKEFGTNLAPSKFEQDEEKALYEKIQELNKELEKEIINEVNIDPAKLIDLTGPINKFFDNVMVNAEDQELRKNRHMLVNYANSVLAEFADFQLL